MSGWVEHAHGCLEQAGYRSGAARRAVVEWLGAQDCAVSAREVEDALRAEGRGVGRASVYRTLEQLAALKLVTRLEVGDGMARYEAVDPSGEHHHHLICDDCGSVTPFEDDDLERSLARLARRLEFDVAEHDVVLHGNCGCRD
jgi:Fur family transcriptional regulator, ferric uptake regulator